ncbi:MULTISPECIES: hypothetical protein [unclassified Vibrio]|uniref:hypothetical protein n=1 Tax=unclassified Vibrio TaxID=2614977 RepID=UPI00354FA3D3
MKKAIQPLQKIEPFKLLTTATCKIVLSFAFLSIIWNDPQFIYGAIKKAIKMGCK